MQYCSCTRTGEMWKLFSAWRTLNQRSPLHTHHAISIGKRYFLSEAFQCKSAWEKRFQTPILQNLNLEELFHALDEKFNHYGRASVLDIDLFANAVRNKSYAHELEDVIYKLRLNVNSTKTLPSTHHAVVRYFLDIGQNETLLRILNDRLVYGVFPDSYCVCLMLDTFIKKKQISEAARVSAIHVLQDNWSNPLVTSLAMFACHMYVQNLIPWESEIEEKNSVEKIKAQVEYIPYPYFDKSSELQDPHLLVGKTLANIGAIVPDSLGQTYRLVGLGLNRKWEEAISLLEQLSNTSAKSGIFAAGLEIFKETFEKELKDGNHPESKLLENLRGLMQELDNKGLVTSDDLHAAVVSKVKQIVAKEENNVIRAQEALYREWEETRERLLKEEMEAQKGQESVIEQKREQLIEREQELFFDENFDLVREKQDLKKMQVEDKEVRS